MKTRFTKTILEYRSNDDTLYSLIRVISFDKREPTHFSLIVHLDNLHQEVFYQTFWDWFFNGDSCRRVLNSIIDSDYNVATRSFTKITYWRRAYD